MRRREFIAGAAGAAAWPRLVRAQASGRMRPTGLLTNLTRTDNEGRARDEVHRGGGS
jgi:hypothetical protein